MILGFTGSRQGCPRVQLAELQTVLHECAGATEAHHGAAVGADAQFAALAALMPGGRVGPAEGEGRGRVMSGANELLLSLVDEARRSDAALTALADLLAERADAGTIREALRRAMLRHLEHEDQPVLDGKVVTVLERLGEDMGVSLKLWELSSKGLLLLSSLTQQQCLKLRGVGPVTKDRLSKLLRSRGLCFRDERES